MQEKKLKLRLVVRLPRRKKKLSRRAFLPVLTT
jgi:hypothetical protein